MILKESIFINQASKGLFILIFILLLGAVSCSGKSGVNVAQQEKQIESVSGFTTEADSGMVDLTVFYTTDADCTVFDEYIAYIDPFKTDPISVSDLIIETAQFFLDKPYVASTLEIEPEGLIINLREFDCTTFVETVLALSRVVRMYDHPTFDDFCRLLQNIRYRRGFVGDYTDRNHYFSDWIYENETRGYVKDITKKIGGEPYKLNLHFMSSHPENYSQLKSHPEYIEIMRRKEISISERDIYALIPEAKITSCEAKMWNGDIVCFVTNIEGLDVSHVGIVYCHEGKTSFIHASTGAKKVIIEPLGLSVYVEKNKRNTGIMLVRPQFPE